MRIAGRRLWLVLLLAGLGFVGWRIFAFVERPVVQEVEAKPGRIAEVVYATGVVEPVQWAKVIPKVRDRITGHCDCEGKQVKKGDVLVTLDDDEPKAQLRELEGRLDYAQRHNDRTAELARRNVATADTLEKAQSDLTQIKALIAAQRERVDEYQLRAPMDGVVMRRDFQVGEVVSTTDVVAWVGQPKPMRIVAEVAEEDIGAVKPGQNVLIRHDAFKGQALSATVERVTPKGDPGQKTFRTYLSLPDDTPLKVGMSIEANIVLAERQSQTTVPLEALRASSVGVIVDQRLSLRPVTVGLRGLSRAEITSGLEEGARVIAPLPADLREGQLLRRSGEGLLTGLGLRR